MSWKDNSLMWWKFGNNLYKVSDHNRSPLSEDYERIESKTRLADGTLRRYTVAKKRTWTCSWENLPSHYHASGIKTADNGIYGSSMETLYNGWDAPFRLILRRGNARNLETPNPADSALPYQDANFYIANVMFTDFSKEVVKRGPKVDLWNLSVTLEEV